MEQTTNLKMPFIMPSQAQKHVTHNEALLALDVLVQLSVLNRHLTAPPPLPIEGSRYIVAASPTGAWAGKSGQVAAWQDGAWAFHPPLNGWLAWVTDEKRILAHDGSSWVDTLSLGINPASMVGINATADATNRLAVKSPAVLFDNQGAGQQVKVNKAAIGDTASVPFQTGYSGRAEFGLTGDDDWHVKVSPDGSAWTEALRVSNADGRVLLPAAAALTDQNQVVAKRHVRELLTANRTYYVRTDGSNSNNGLSNTGGGAFLTIQKAIDTAAALDLSIFSVTIQVGAGTYSGSNTFKSYVGAGPIIIVGDVGTPSNIVISTTSMNCFYANGVIGAYELRGMKLLTTTSGAGIRIENGSILRFSALEFGACATAHILCTTKAMIAATGSYSISGGAARHWWVETQALLTAAALTITINGNPAFTSGFAVCLMASMIQCNGNTFAGAATGLRYSVSGNSVIFAGSGATYLPGDSAGSAATGGQYL